MNSILKIQELMQEVFDDDSIVLTSNTTADDIEEWDSMNHVRLIVAIEKAVGKEFPVQQVSELRNVGDLAALIDSISGR